MMFSSTLLLSYLMLVCPNIFWSLVQYINTEHIYHWSRAQYSMCSTCWHPSLPSHQNNTKICSFLLFPLCRWWKDLHQLLGIFCQVNLYKAQTSPSFLHYTHNLQPRERGHILWNVPCKHRYLMCSHHKQEAGLFFACSAAEERRRVLINVWLLLPFNWSLCISVEKHY